MLSFKEYLSEQKNTHMTHIEDQVIYGGVKGARDAIMALRSVRDMLAGNSKTSTDITVKWDGAPAVFGGIDPSDGQFFVAKKGIFAKNPKVYKSHEEIDADMENDLARKMKAAFDAMSQMGITNGVIQGDIMFTQDDLKTETIDGEKYVTFHPNTIVYALPVNSEAGKDVLRSKVGIVFHTSYMGSSFEDMKASFGVDLSKYKNVSGAWLQSADYHDLSGKATLTKAETEELNKELSFAGKTFRKIAGDTLRQLENEPELPKMIETYNNSFVRAKKEIGNTKTHVEGLIKFIQDKFQKEADKRKTEKGKMAQFEKRDAILAFFSPKNKASLVQMFELQLSIQRSKKIIINKLNELGGISTFVKTKNGFKVTGAEGFVAIDRMDGKAVKLVDRMEFSTNNFDPDVIKGWDSPTRG
jgi:hypothetical protein